MSSDNRYTTDADAMQSANSSAGARFPEKRFDGHNVRCSDGNGDKACERDSGKINVNPANTLQLEGSIVRVSEFSVGKAANIIVAVKLLSRSGAEYTNYIELKSFNPSCFKALKTGQKVRVYGHVENNHYQKDGQTIYMQNLVSDVIVDLKAS